MLVPAGRPEPTRWFTMSCIGERPDAALTRCLLSEASLLLRQVRISAASPWNEATSASTSALFSRREILLMVRAS